MMVAIIEDLTVLVRAQEGGRELVLQEVPLRPTLDEVLERVRPLAMTRRVQVDVDDMGPFVAYAEPRLLARALENVLVNAVQYNRDGGCVSVRARYDEQADDRPSLIVLSVADTGPGIPESERDRIFERFYRVDRSRARHTGGTGLGLAICREVLTAMHGSVRVAASGPAGTTLDVSIPGALVKGAN